MVLYNLSVVNGKIVKANVYGSVIQREIGLYEKEYDIWNNHKRKGSDIDVVVIAEKGFKPPKSWIFIKSYKDYDSLRTVIPMEKSPYKMYTIESNILSPLFKKANNILEPYNQPRQILPKTYMHNGYLDIIKTTSVIRMNSISGNKIYPYVLSADEIDDIDTIDDWKRSEEKNKVI